MAEDDYESCVYYAFIVEQVKVDFKPTCFSGLHWMMKTKVNSLPLFPSAAATPFRVIDTQIKSRHYVSNSLNTGAWAMCVVSVCADLCAHKFQAIATAPRSGGEVTLVYAMWINVQVCVNVKAETRYSPEYRISSIEHGLKYQHMQSTSPPFQ